VQILNTLVRTKMTTSNLVAPSLNYATIAALTEGYLPADLRDLVDRAIHQGAMRTSAPSSVSNFSALSILLQR
jgi:peroxin-1